MTRSVQIRNCSLKKCFMSLILNALVIVMVVYVAKYTRIRITDNGPGGLELFKNFGDRPI